MNATNAPWSKDSKIAPPPCTHGTGPAAIDNALHGNLLHHATPMRADKGSIAAYFSSTQIAPTPPAKIILGIPSLMDVFKKSATFAKVLCYIEACAESIKGTPHSHRLHPSPVNPAVKYILEVFFPSLRDVMKRVPLAELSTQRFGNSAKKLFHEEMEKELLPHMLALVNLFPICWKCAFMDNRREIKEIKMGGRVCEYTQEGPSTPTAQSTATSGGDGAGERMAGENDGNCSSSSAAPAAYRLCCIHGCSRANEKVDEREPNQRGSESEEEEAKKKNEVGKRLEKEYNHNKHNNNHIEEEEPDENKVNAKKEELAKEMAEYIKDSFGDPFRLDYGSGHELHFFIFMIICLESYRDAGGLLDPSHTLFHVLNLHTILPHPPPAVPSDMIEQVRGRRQEFIFFVFREYLSLMRAIQEHYHLEPAGSHGVWGLDDYHHLPYVFGAAQLIHFDIRTPFFNKDSQGRDTIRPPLPLPPSSSLPDTADATSASSMTPESLQEEVNHHHYKDSAQKEENTAAPVENTPPPPTLSIPSSSSISRPSSASTLLVVDAPPCDPVVLSSSSPPPPFSSSAFGSEHVKRFRTEDVCVKEKVFELKDEYFYLHMISWIYTHKHGPFHEHSNMLYNISSVATWEKTYVGMMKMYMAQVLGKFNVAQHFLFGVHLPWNTKSLEDPTPQE